jgi:hypothetical protein
MGRALFSWDLFVFGEPAEGGGMKRNRFVTLARTSAQVQNIATADSAAGDWPYRAIFRIWPDFEVYRQIDASTTTIKAVPAQRSFAAFGDGIVWAVIDTGIDGIHPALSGGRIQIRVPCGAPWPTAVLRAGFRSPGARLRSRGVARAALASNAVSWSLQRGSYQAPDEISSHSY